MQNHQLLLYIPGNSLSIVTLHLIKWRDARGQTQTFRLVDRVSASWRRFGMILRLAENQLEKWDDEYRGDANNCWARVMGEWLNQCTEDYPASWEGLYTLLDDAEFSEVAQELRKAVDGASSIFADEDRDPVDSSSDEVAANVDSSATDNSEMDSTTATAADDLCERMCDCTSKISPLIFFCVCSCVQCCGEQMGKRKTAENNIAVE